MHRGVFQTKASRRSAYRSLSLGMLTLGLAGCSAPRPELAVAPSVLSEEWQGAATAVDMATPLSQSWTAFGSPELVRLIEQARAANPDVAIAAARIMQARGQIKVARAATMPEVTANTGIGTERRNLSSTGSVEDMSAGLDVAYEVDLFGAGRAGKRSARARLAAARFDRDAVALLIESEVARAYIQHATLSDRVQLIDRALGHARELDRIIGVRVREGAATRVESGIQTIEVRRLEAERSRISEAMARTRNALAVLIGEEAPRFAVEEASLDDFSVPMFDPAQPAELLVRRPDVRSAEALIVAAEGDVAKARAAFLPSLRISAGSLLGAQGIGAPLQLLASAGASLLAPIFDGGRLRGNLMTAGGVQRESVEAYRKALLAAFGETEDALAGVEHSRTRERLLADTVEQARTTAHLARRQFVEGAADLQTVLDAERGLVDIEEARALAAQDRLNAAIDLYKALGGRPL